MLNPKEQKIFLVDDDSLCLHLHQQFLVKLGYTDISCFNGGKDCLANLHQRPAIIFLDYTMEEMNGIDVLQSIKTFDDNINVVFISGQERVNIAVDALKYGAFDYIVKSRITVDVLQRTIERIVAEKRVTVIPVKKGFFSRMKSNWGR